MRNKIIYFTVTTDLNYDQRMIRICTSLCNAGYEVHLIGRNTRKSLPLGKQPFQQKRLNLIFETGKLFYIEYNIRLFFYLLFKKMDAICAIDLDTILPCYLVSTLKNKQRFYDAHELFCEMKEISSRPMIYRVWKKLEKMMVPKFPLGYTVNKPIAEEFFKIYGVRYQVIRNIALLKPLKAATPTEKYLLYQGALNEGRSFETLIPAMKEIPCKLIICGEGNFSNQARALVKKHQLEDKVIFKGMLLPEELKTITRNAYMGLTLFDPQGLSNYYSLANRFFDYLHAGIPQICVDYPVYREINQSLPFALLIEDISSENISRTVNNLLNNELMYNELASNCIKARESFNWQQEEKILVEFYKMHL